MAAINVNKLLEPFFLFHLQVQVTGLSLQVCVLKALEAKILRIVNKIAQNPQEL